MRRVNKIIVHCSASDEPKDDDFERLDRFHSAPPSKMFNWGRYRVPGRNFYCCGYHYVITKDGTVHTGRPIHRMGAHCLGHNADSIGVCVTGDTVFSVDQFGALHRLLSALMAKYGLDKSKVYPHYYFNKLKTCPNFDLQIILEG